MTTKTELATRKTEAIESLKAWGIVEGSTLQTFTRYVGNYGTAYVKVYLIDGDRLINLTWTIANAIGDKAVDRDGSWHIKTTGYGYNRAQHVIDAVSWALFGDSGKLQYHEH
jgi:hypothetical protein